MGATKAARETRKIKVQKAKLVSEYKQIQDWIFDYKGYVQSCKGKCMKPRELITRRDELFKEISKLTRRIRKQEGG